MKNIKVQILGHITAASIRNGVKDEPNRMIEVEKYPFTFIAYSDTMKARTLESFLNPKNAGKIILSLTDEKKDGEWHEEQVVGGILNISA